MEINTSVLKNTNENKILEMEKNHNLEDSRLKINQMNLLNFLRIRHNNLPKNTNDYLMRCRKGVPNQKIDADFYVLLFSALFNPQTLNQLILVDDIFYQRKILKVDNRVVTLTMYVLHHDIDMIFYKMFKILFGKVTLNDYVFMIGSEFSNNDSDNMKTIEKCTHKDECKHCDFLIRLQDKKTEQIMSMFTYVMNHIIVDKDFDEDNLIVLRNLHNPSTYGLSISNEKKQRINNNKISSTILQLMAESESLLPNMYSILENLCPYIMKNVKTIQKMKQQQNLHQQAFLQISKQSSSQKKKSSTNSLINNKNISSSSSIDNPLKSPVNEQHDKTMKKRKFENSKKQE
jgi:hypothetical protein